MSSHSSNSSFSTEDKQQLAQQFLTALRDRNWDVMHSLFTPDATWTMPGTGTISGTATGADEVVAKAQQIVSYGLNFELLYILIGQHDMALSLHNTATRDSLKLDEYLSTVCHLRDGKISGIDTYISDVEGFNIFFAEGAPNA